MGHLTLSVAHESDGPPYLSFVPVFHIHGSFSSLTEEEDSNFSGLYPSTTTKSWDSVLGLREPPKGNRRVPKH